MKKKYIVLGIITVIAACISIWLLTRPKVLGSINHSYTEPTTNNSEFSFTGEAREKIKFSFRSDVKNGELDILLYDSKGDVVYKLARAKALEMYFVLSDTDTYTLASECNNFSGDFKIKVTEAN